MPSSPARDDNDITMNDNTLRSPEINANNNTESSPAHVPSSPLFLPQSSSPAPTQGNINSSSRNHQSQNQRSNRTPNVSSDILRSSDSSRQRYQGRGDLNGTEMFSSPMRRRYFNEPRNGNSSINDSSPLPNRSNLGDLSSDVNATDNESRRIIPSFSSSSFADSDGFQDNNAHNNNNNIDTDNLDSNSLDSERNNNIRNQNLSDIDDNRPIRVIWGTHVSIENVTDRFTNFLMTFKMNDRYAYDGNDDVIDPTGDKPYYVQKLNELKETGSTNLNLDVQNLMSVASTRKIANHLILYPQEVIPVMDQVVKDCLISIVLDDPEFRDTPETSALHNEIESKFYKVRPYNIGNKKGMRELNPQDIDKLVSIKGLVIRATPILPDMKNAFFKCNVCDHTVVVENDRGIIQEPRKCPRQQCNSSNSMQLIHNRSIFANKQIIKLQETPDIVPDGQTPHSVSLCVYDELVDSCRAGDRIEVCGIFKSSPVRVNPRLRVVKSLFKTYLDVVHIKKIDKHRIGIDVSTIENELREQEQIDEIRKLSQDEIDKITNVANRPDVYELLARSLAPSIFEMDDVKKGLLLQLFGGTNKDFKKGSRTRGDINILLCGDPSTSKSQILQYVHKISPRGIYTSGKGSSAVGLTAYVTRDIETKQLVLESGALVLSDGGVCCIDEFDKMSDQTRSVLHEVMEQQTISIAKAGIITTLNARTSILASANPIESRYNPDLPVTKNIDLPPPLLSRFDLVFLILDKVDKKLDEQLAKHIASMYLEDHVVSVSEHEILPVEFLTGYIQYAKENIHPNLTEEARDELVSSYVSMRKAGEDSRNGGTDKRITATTRQLESLIRLSEAHAKIFLRNEVLLEDVIEAVRLMKSAIKDYATDPLTGRIDMDLIQTGVSVEDRRRKESLDKDIVKVLEIANEIDWSGLADEIEKLRDGHRVENFELGESIRRLEGDGKVIVFGQGSHRRVAINRGVV
jgi:DNA replication licensing factor MCM4